MTNTESSLRAMLAEQYNVLQQHDLTASSLGASIGAPCTCEEDEPGSECTCRTDDEYRADAAREAQLALAASNAMQAIAVLIAREPAAA